jgi:glutamate--cysteine ligase
VQVNLDYSSEADMVKKMRVGLALQPVVGAMFANSAIVEGKQSGFLSYRNNIWLDVDPDRSGNSPFAFESGMGYERYADYMLDMPMYGTVRDGKFVNAAGHSFRDFMDGNLAPLFGEYPTIEDFEHHLTTAFPNVRLKRYIELRGADSGDWGSLCALPALWTGLYYDQATLDAAWDLVKGWSAEERETLRLESPKTALHTKFRKGTLHDIAKEIFTLSESGLKNRARLDASGKDERIYLEPLREIVETGKSPAELILSCF